MTHERNDPTRALERYRADYLRLRSVLHDRTTALPAYPLLMDRLRAMLDDRRCVGVVHLAVTNLATVESLYGWQVFDRILAHVSGTLRSMVGRELPGSALLGVDRVAGEEFLAFLPETPRATEVDEAFLAEVGEAARAALTREFDADDFAGLNPRLEFRAGHALLTINPFYRFERRVYGAVEEARTRDRRRAQRRDRSRSRELHRILDEAAVRTVFQPVLELETRRVLGYEAFARGPKDSTLEMPHALFALSDEEGVAAELDRLCRRIALEESAGVTGRGELFLNVLPGSLDDPDWGDGGPARTQAAWADKWNLVLEVSERGADADRERFVGALGRLKQRGFSLALDDIGTGYASLTTLESVRPDYLKVDATLVRDLHAHLIKQEVLASLVQIAERIGAAVIAEGVESEDEARALERLGARFGQGYLFAQPSPAHRAGRTGPAGTDPEAP